MSRYLAFAFMALFLVTDFGPMIRPSKAEERGSFQPGALGIKVPILEREGDAEKYVGRLVAVRGTVSDSKIPRIRNVEVRADDSLRNREAYAVGILIKWTITEVDPLVASEGPGTYFVLYFDLAGKITEARPLAGK